MENKEKIFIIVSDDDSVIRYLNTFLLRKDKRKAYSIENSENILFEVFLSGEGLLYFFLRNGENDGVFSYITKNNEKFSLIEKDIISGKLKLKKHKINRIKINTDFNLN